MQEDDGSKQEYIALMLALIVLRRIQSGAIARHTVDTVVAQTGSNFAGDVWQHLDTFLIVNTDEKVLMVFNRKRPLVAAKYLTVHSTHCKELSIPNCQQAEKLL